MFELENLGELRYLEKFILKIWKERGIKVPKTKDAAIFLITEAAEVLDAVMRMESGWVRTNKKEINIGEELADVITMAILTAHSAGVENLYEVIVKKLTKHRGEE